MQRNNVVYDYAADATGGGDMQIAVHNLTTDARFSLHSRWKSDGEGRADVNGSGLEISPVATLREALTFLKAD